MKKISIVILNWNGKKLLEKFLPSVIQHSNVNLADIIVADNASTDESINYIITNHPNVKVVRLDQNYGYAAGYNRALKFIKSEYFILLNSDVEVTPRWLEPILDFFEQNPNIAALQPKILDEKDKDYFEYAGACGGFIDKYGYPFCRGRIFDSVEKDFKQYDAPIEIFWASGACLAIRSDCFFEVGGFDDSFFAHMEEIDLCWRLKARNKKIMCIPQSTIYHVGGATLKEENPRKTYLNFRNNLLMLYKNLPKKEFHKTFRVRFCLDYIAAIKMLLEGKAQNGKAILKAHADFRKTKHKYDYIRSENIAKTTLGFNKLIYSRSILYSYYFKKKKFFSQLKK